MKRFGLTLLEVLMAIFIMGIGMLSILAMYPVAGEMLSRAISNSQMAEGMVGARGIQDNFDLIATHTDLKYLLRMHPFNPGYLGTLPGDLTPYDPDHQISQEYNRYDSVNNRRMGNDVYGLYPARNFGASNLPVGWLPGEIPTTDYPLYLFVDQHARVSNTVASFLNGGNGTVPINYAFIPQINYPSPTTPYSNRPFYYDLRPRRFSNTSLSEFANRFFTVNSDVVLNKNGLANKDDDDNPTTVDRQGRFTVAYFYEKPFPRTVPNYTNRYILVFKDRAETISDYPLLHENIISSINSGPSALFGIPIPANRNIKARDWLVATGLRYGNRMPPSLVDFVQVKSVNENLNTNTLDIEVSPPFRGSVNRLYFLTDVSYVFYRENN